MYQRSGAAHDASRWRGEGRPVFNHRKTHDDGPLVEVFSVKSLKKRTKRMALTFSPIKGRGITIRIKWFILRFLGGWTSSFYILRAFVGFMQLFWGAWTSWFYRESMWLWILALNFCWIFGLSAEGLTQKVNRKNDGLACDSKTSAFSGGGQDSAKKHAHWQSTSPLIYKDFQISKPDVKYDIHT